MPYIDSADQTIPPQPTIVARSRIVIGRPGRLQGPYRVAATAGGSQARVDAALPRPTVR